MGISTCDRCFDQIRPTAMMRVLTYVRPHRQQCGRISENSNFVYRGLTSPWCHQILDIHSPVSLQKVDLVTPRFYCHLCPCQDPPTRLPPQSASEEGYANNFLPQEIDPANAPTGIHRDSDGFKPISRGHRLPTPRLLGAPTATPGHKSARHRSQC